MPFTKLTAMLAAIFVTLSAWGQSSDQVGTNADGVYLLPTMQMIQPAGDTLTFGGRPVDLALTPDNKTLFVKYEQGILVVDAEAWKIRYQIGMGEGGSMHGVAVNQAGTHVYVSGNYNVLWDGEISTNGTVDFSHKVNLL